MDMKRNDVTEAIERLRFPSHVSEYEQITLQTSPKVGNCDMEICQ